MDKAKHADWPDCPGRVTMLHSTLLSLVNEIVEAAVNHGGPYGSNVEGLFRAMKSFRDKIGAYDYAIIGKGVCGLAYERRGDKEVQG